MHRTHRFSTFAMCRFALASLIVVPVICTAGEITLEIPGIPGTMTDAKALGLPPDSINVLAVSFGATNSGTTHVGSGGGSGKTSIQDITLTKKLDNATPLLFKSLVTGQHYPTMTITYWTGNGVNNPVTKYFTIALTEVIVSSQSQGAAENAGIANATENISLNFAAICLTDELTSTKSCYNIVTNIAN